MKYRDDLLGRIVLGRYRVVRRLAKGGMGLVYLGRQEGAAGFAKPVVIKRMITELADEQMERMFVREARILSKLQHRGIVGVLDFGREEGAYLLVMEYVHGYHLGRWHRFLRDTSGPMPAPIAIHIVIHVLEALHYAHTRRRPDGELLGIVHRDVSPSNVFLDADGHVKLLDFGIARASGDDEEYKTQDTTVKGKLAYLPPENFRGEAATPRTDVYSCGVVLHELLVGRNEFRGAEMSDTLNLVLTHEPTKVRSLRGDVPAEIDDIIARALHKDPEQRYPDAETFAQALRDVRGVGEGEADAMLAQAIARDFASALPEKLNLPTLDDLDDTWRNPPRPDPTLSTDPPPRLSQPPTVALTAPESDGVAVAKPSSRLPIPAVLAVLLVAGGTAVFLAIRNETPTNAPELVVIQQTTPSRADAPPRVAEDDGSSTGAGDESAPVAPDAGAAEVAAPTPSKRGGTKAPRPGVDALSAAFARQSGQIEQCFATHTEELSGAPRLQVRFSVDARGAVQAAQLIPAEVSSTPLGQCILRVARGTDFPARGEPTTFRIPIVARRGS